ncbi:hypothetical protein TNCV_4519051 [Trichonephila clavipes]|nr:hypothetical protein TNCV_4519051 [Trichonephila clavipes]
MIPEWMSGQEDAWNVHVQLEKEKDADLSSFGALSAEDLRSPFTLVDRNLLLESLSGPAYPGPFAPFWAPARPKRSIDKLALIIFWREIIT